MLSAVFPPDIAQQHVPASFEPHRDLASRLLPFASSGNDGSHDVTHLQRVWRNVRLIQAEEGGDSEVLLAAVVLHDCTNIEKNSPLRRQASRLAARKAVEILDGMCWRPQAIAAVAHAIEAHSVSAGIRADTLEAKILQDADRLDALGMVGIARCFYVAGRLGSALYDHHDPYARQRPYDEKRFTIDHFHTRLLRLADNLHTRAGARLACERSERLRWFLDNFLEEVLGDTGTHLAAVPAGELSPIALSAD
jgi:uncharacterized protein